MSTTYAPPVNVSGLSALPAFAYVNPYTAQF